MNRWAAGQLAAGGAWAAVAHLGLEASAPGLRVEVAGHNILASAENDGSCEATPAIPGAPCVLATTAPLGRLNLREKEAWSTSAGCFYCNELYYRTLAAIRLGSARGRLTPALFAHLPSEATAPVDAYLPRVLEVLDALAGRSPEPPRAPLRRLAAQPRSCDDFFGPRTASSLSVVTVIDPDIPSKYCDAANVSWPCAFVHHSGPYSQCLSPSPPDACHRYFRVTYERSCGALTDGPSGDHAAWADVDAARRFDLDTGVLSACADEVAEVHVSCWAPPGPHRCACPD